MAQTHSALAQDVPYAGDHGPGLWARALNMPDDYGKTVGLEIITFPAGASNFILYDNSSFELEGPDGLYTFQWQPYVDGVPAGRVQTETVLIGDGFSGAGSVAVSTNTTNTNVRGIKQSFGAVHSSAC